MAGGGKGGSQEQSVTLPPELMEGASAVLASALRSASLPYRPNRTPTIAAFSPQQMAAFEGANEAANAYGLPSADISGYLPAPEMSASGFSGYSTGDMYDEAVTNSMTAQDIALRDALLDSYAASASRVQAYEPFDSLLGVTPQDTTPFPTFASDGGNEYDVGGGPGDYNGGPDGYGHGIEGQGFSGFGVFGGLGDALGIGGNNNAGADGGDGGK